MGYIVSLQGGMAAGKTTLAKALQTVIPNIKVSLENPSGVIEIVKKRGLNKNIKQDYLEIQRLFIKSEIRRYKQLSQYPKVVIDLGPEEIEFYTINYPKSIGQCWNIEELLKPELTDLRACQLTKIIYLDANIKTLTQHKEFDKTRRRGFFNQYINTLHSLKRDWFLNKENVAVIDVNNLSAKQILTKAERILSSL